MKITDAQIEELKQATKLIKREDYLEYVELKKLKNEIDTNFDEEQKGEFCRRFSHYYKLNAAMLSGSFKNEYFKILFERVVELNGEKYPVIKDDSPDFAIILEKLSNPILNNQNRVTLHFSFVSKLVNFLKEDSPLLDKFVLSFFCREIPNSALSKEKRINCFINFIDELSETYKQLEKDQRISKELSDFRNNNEILKKCHMVRVIDFLIWKVGQKKHR